MPKINVAIIMRVKKGQFSTISEQYGEILGTIVPIKLM